MKTSLILREIMENSNIGTSVLAKRLGSSRQAMNGRVTRDNLAIDTLNEILRVMDYKLVIMPNDKRTPEGGYEVD